MSVVAEHARIKITESPLLDLRTSSESPKHFRLRIQEFMVGFQLDVPDTPTKQPTVYVCTHQDWAEEFLTIVESSTDLTQTKYSGWASGQYMFFAKTDLWHVMDFGRI